MESEEEAEAGRVEVDGEDVDGASLTGARTCPVDEPPVPPGGKAAPGEGGEAKGGMSDAGTGKPPPEEVTFRRRAEEELAAGLNPEEARAASHGGRVGLFLGRGGITRGLPAEVPVAPVAEGTAEE